MAFSSYIKIPEDELVRVEFNEITKDAVLNAMKRPRAIDKIL